MFQCCSLGSGSKGNGTLVQTKTTTILIDCGFGIRDLTKRLNERGIGIENLDAIFVTHEHSDHSSGVARVAKKNSIPVYATRGTALHASCSEIPTLNIIEAENAIMVGDIEVFPFTVPHDSREPVQFSCRHQGKTIGVLSDLGSLTPHLIEILGDCHLLMLEFNHDFAMLQNGPYPPSLKSRIAGDLGHLSNQQSEQVLQLLNGTQLKKVAATHLSEENNCKELVKDILLKYFKEESFWIADQTVGTPWLQVS